MAINEEMVKASEPLARTLMPREQFDLQRRVNRAIDGAGNIVLRAEPFVRLRSPDGSVWRVKVDNAGALTTSKE